MYFRPVAAAALGCLIAAPALAQDRDTPRIEADASKLDNDVVTIGLGIGAVPSYEGSNDFALSVVPGIRASLSGFSFALRGNRFSSDLIPDNKGRPGWDIQFGPSVEVNLNRHLLIIDPRVRRLPKRGVAIQVGARAGISRQGVITSDYDTLGASIAYVKDVAGVHDSYVVTPAIDYMTPLSRKAMIDLNLSADYVGEGYADTYFSVDAAGSAASGLPVFTAHRGWKDWTLATTGMVALTGDLTGGLAAIGSVSYRRMLEDSARSPLTSIAGSPDQWTGILGLAYTF